MSIAVVTPFFNTPRPWLQQCLDSVAGQTRPCTHFLVGDGDTPIGLEMGRHVRLLRLPEPHGDNGNAARAIGSVSAICQGFEAIAYLDADNWYEPNHLEELWRAHERTRAAICTSGRNLYDLEGNLLGPCPEVDGTTFVDTSCLFLTKAAFGLVSVWYMMPKGMSPVCDRVFWAAALKANLARTHLPAPTLAFRTNYAVHYRFFGKEPPPGAKGNAVGQEPSPRPTQNPSPPTPAPRIVPSSTKQTVSLCMIVKDEEKNLAECLESVAGLFDEIIVVDTGSTDRTREIALKHQAKVVPFSWVEDFSAARNEGLRHASGGWIFWMDADDRLDESNRQKLRALLANLPDGNYAYMMKQWSPADNPYASALVVDHVRLFRKQPGACWRYRLHEQILTSLREAKAQVVVTDIQIRHLGYSEPGLRRRKLERNLHILLQEEQQQPEDAFTLFNLAGTYLDLGEREKALSYLQGCVAHTPKGASFLPKVYVLLIQTHRLAGRLEEALAAVHKAKKDLPLNAELLLEEGLVHLGRKEHLAAQRAFEQIPRLGRGPRLVGTEEGVHTYLPRHHLALALRGQRQFLAAEEQWGVVLDQAPHYVPSWLALMDLLLEQKRFSDAQALFQRSQTLPRALGIGPILMARIQIATDGTSAAIETLENSLAEEPGNHLMRLLLCDVLVRHAKELDRAEHHLLWILAADPQHGQAKAKLDQLRQKKMASPLPGAAP